MLLLADGVSRLLLANGVDRLLLASDADPASSAGGARIIQRRNKLIYPAGAAPGIDETHVAVRNGIIRFSGVATSGGLVDILRGRKPSTIALTPSFKINTQGPSFTVAAGAQVSFSGQNSTAGQTKVTIAAIVNAANFNNFKAICSSNSSSSAAGATLFGETTPIVSFRLGNINCDTTLPLVANVPYFIAASADKGTGIVNAVTCRLDTGVVRSFTSTFAITTQSFDSDGVFVVGGWGGGGLQFEGAISAVAYVSSFLSVSELLQFAADPWSFWYPNKPINLTSDVAAVTPPVTTGGARVLQRFNKSKLAYPAGSLPGIDPAHPAANKLTFSAVSTGRSFVDLRRGAQADSISVSGASVDGVLGIATKFVAATSWVTFYAVPYVSNGTARTLAGIFRSTSAADTQTVIGLAKLPSSFDSLLYYVTDGNSVGWYDGAGHTVNLNVATNQPYFLAASANSAGVNFVLKNLATGQVQSAAFTGAISFPNSGTDITVGADIDTGGSDSMGGVQATAMMNQTYMSMQQLLDWSKSPWDFWYPNKPINLTSDIAVVTPPVTTGGARVLQRFNRSKLAYPAGALPGFDPNHVASKNMSPGHGLLAVAVPGGAGNGNMLNLLKGRPATIRAPNIVPSGINGAVGPFISPFTAGANPPIADSGNAAVIDPKQTLAAIFFYKSGQTDNPVFIGSGNSYQFANFIGIGGPTNEVFIYNNGGQNSGIILNNNEAYFLAVSNDGVTLNFIVKSLKTGKVVTSTLANTDCSTAYLCSGTYAICGDEFNNQPQFPVAAVSYTPAFLSPAQLRQWAEDPWSFWYPNKTININGGTADSGAAISGTLAVTEAKDTVNFAGSVVVSGTLAVTEAKDTANFAGSVVVSGTLAVTEAADTALFAGSVVVSGTLAVTESTDTANFAGSVVVSGTLAVTEAKDTANFAVSVVVSGTLAVTESTDTANFAGSVVVSGTLAVTESPDTALFAGTVGDVIGATLVATESPDTAVFAGSVLVSGTLAVTEAKDTANFAGSVLVSGTLAVTEAADTANFAGSVVVSGTLAVTEATDTANFAGTVISGIGAVFAVTEAADTAVFAGSVVVSGTLTVTEAKDTALFAGSVVVSGTFATTEAKDTALFAGSVVVSGTLTVTEAKDTCVINGAVTFATVTGTLAVTEAKDTCVINGAVTGVIGTLAVTEATDTCAINGNLGTIPAVGTFTVTEAKDTCVFFGAPIFEWVPITPPDEIWVPITPPDEVWIPTIAATNIWTPVV